MLCHNCTKALRLRAPLCAVSSPLQAFSLHSYGKQGYALWQTGNNTNVSVALTRTTPIPASVPTLPFVITEHASHTTATWNALTTNSETFFEAARLASQMLFMASNGWESYIFKARRAE